jgi:hypothetical protein
VVCQIAPGRYSWSDGSSPSLTTKTMYNHITEYTKPIPSFFQHLLSKLNRLKINKIECDLISTLEPAPWQSVHYRPTKDGIQIITSPIIKLSHEMAHFLEVRDDKKLLLHDYGIRKYFPTTLKGRLQAVAREARTRGIQTRLVQIAFGQCQMLYHGGAGTLAEPYSDSKFKCYKDMVNWSNSILETAYDNWCEDKIVTIWNKKAEYINTWLETLSEYDPFRETLQRYSANYDWRWPALKSENP